MRLKVFTAATMALAMGQVRTALGDNAIIVGTANRTDGMIEVTAARDDDGSAHAAGPMPLDLFTADPEVDLLTDEDVRLGLQSHGTPSALIDRLAEPWSSDTSATTALAAAIDRVFGFRPLATPLTRPLMFVGPPGAGKTTVIAKLAARLCRQGRGVRVITVDTRRAGAVEQLGAYTRILKLRLVVARTPDALRSAVDTALRDAADPILIDTPGGNPFAEADRRSLHGLIKAAGAEPVLVLPAGGDPVEAIDLGGAYADVGISRLVATRLDLARRLGGLFAVAAAARTAFAEASVSDRIADDLVPLDPGALARLILPEPVLPERPVWPLELQSHEVSS